MSFSFHLTASDSPAYNHCKNVAIGTGVPAAVMLVTAVALGTLATCAPFLPIALPALIISIICSKIFVHWLLRRSFMPSGLANCVTINHQVENYLFSPPLW